MRAFIPDQPIETRDGLYEALTNIFRDEFPRGATLAQLRARLPYGRRVENMVREMTVHGEVRRVARGFYIPEIKAWS